MLPDGLVGRPWFQHVLYAPGSYTGYSSVEEPGVTEALERRDSATLRHEADSLAAALTRAAARLDEVRAICAQATPQRTNCRTLKSFAVSTSRA